MGWHQLGKLDRMGGGGEDNNGGDDRRRLRRVGWGQSACPIGPWLASRRHWVWGGGVEQTTVEQHQDRLR